MNRKKINFIMLKLVLTTRNNFTHVFILAQSDLHVFSLGARQMSLPISTDLSHKWMDSLQIAIMFEVVIFFIHALLFIRNTLYMTSS